MFGIAALWIKNLIYCYRINFLDRIVVGAGINFRNKKAREMKVKVILGLLFEQNLTEIITT